MATSISLVPHIWTCGRMENCGQTWP